MNGITIGEMLRACRGEWQGTEETLTKAPSSIVTDSRQAGEGSLFLALRGEKTDGHKYIPDVLRKGALAVLCEERGAAASRASLCRIRSQPCSRSPRQAGSAGTFRLSASPAASARRRQRKCSPPRSPENTKYSKHRAA